MKILNYKVVDNMIQLFTDYDNMPMFVYPINKFKNLIDLKKEMKKKIVWEEKRKAELDKSTLIKELDEELRNVRN